MTRIRIRNVRKGFPETYLQEAFFALSDGRNRQFHHYRGQSGHKTLLVLPCNVHSPPPGQCRYIGQDVGVDCLFCSKALASPDHDKPNIVPRLLLVHPQKGPEERPATSPPAEK